MLYLEVNYRCQAWSVVGHFLITQEMTISTWVESLQPHISQEQGSCTPLHGLKPSIIGRLRPHWRTSKLHLFKAVQTKKNHVHVQLMCQERQREYDTKYALGPGTAKFSSD